jgi:pimeloyl-ACP methyl ester carboxylesterase
LGSFVAQGLTQKYPDRVDHLVLIATAPGGEAAIPAPKEIRDKVQKSLEGSWEKAYVPMMFLDAKDTEAYLKRVADAQKSGELPKSKGETLEAKIAHQSAFADEGKEEARYLELGNIESPTLLITGDKDELTSVKNAELVAERIPKSELVIMPDAGHAVMFEENDDVARLIRGFLR